MKKISFLLGILALSAITFFACKEDEDAVDQAAVAAAEDVSTFEDLSEQADIDLDIAVEERGGGSACPVVTFAQPWGTWPNTITIDYGSGCTLPDGRVLQGQIIVNQSAELFSAGAVRTVTYNGFFMDDVQLLGVKTWTNNGTDSIGQFSYTKTAQDMQLIFADGSSATWNTSRTNTLVEGGSTPTHWDNVWRITGASSGVNRNGEPFSATITTPLVKKAICRWISAGVVEINRAGGTASLDFGDGTCDRWGTLTLPSGSVITIRLRR